MKDPVLIAWIISDFLRDVAILAGTAYVVFWRNQSGWWFLIAVWLMCSPNLFKVLRKRYQIEEHDEDE